MHLQPYLVPAPRRYNTPYTPLRYGFAPPAIYDGPPDRRFSPFADPRYARQPQHALPRRRISASDSFPYMMLKDRRVSYTGNRGWNIEYATAYLTNHLTAEGTNNGQNCVQLLNTWRKHMGKWSSEIYGAFQALDYAFFDHKLHDAVCLVWKDDMSADSIGTTWAEGQKAGPGRICIFMSKAFVISAKQDSTVILGALLHQMIHAYFMATCAPPQEGASRDPRLEHGMHFLKIASVIKDMSVSDNNDVPVPVDFGGVVMKEAPAAICAFGHYSFRHHPGWRHALMHADGGFYDNTSSTTHSLCGAQMKGTEQADIDKWYSSECEPLLKAPKSCQGSKTNVVGKDNMIEEKNRGDISDPYVELIFDDKAICVTRPQLAKHKSVKDKMKRVVKISGNVPKDIFFAMHDFIQNGTYTPDLSSFTSSNQAGPPVIQGQSIGDPTYVLLSVRLLKLGLAMKYKELADEAKRRLYMQPSTREDPIPVLEEIYDGSKAYFKIEKGDSYEIPEDLQLFVKKWMVAYPMSSNPSAESNLTILFNNPRFHRLCQDFPALAKDAQESSMIIHSHLTNPRILQPMLPRVQLPIYPGHPAYPYSGVEDALLAEDFFRNDSPPFGHPGYW